MGMGKTIQTISLLLSDFPDFRQTLIVCPTVCIRAKPPARSLLFPTFVLAVHLLGIPEHPSWSPCSDVSAMRHWWLPFPFPFPRSPSPSQVAILQWKAEILKHTKPDTFKVTVYHGMPQFYF